MADEEESRRDKVYSSISSRADAIKDKTRTITIRAGYIGICFQCQYAFISRASRENDPTITCQESISAFARKPLDIVECNRFQKNGELDMWDLIKSSQILDLSKSTIKVGFTSEEK
jgi:hypothetical protein